MTNLTKQVWEEKDHRKGKSTGPLFLVGAWSKSLRLLEVVVSSGEWESAPDDDEDGDDEDGDSNDGEGDSDEDGGHDSDSNDGDGDGDDDDGVRLWPCNHLPLWSAAIAG